MATLAQVMACCLMAPSHYLNQCWLIISDVFWHLSEGNSTGNAVTLNLTLSHSLSPSISISRYFSLIWVWDLTHWGRATHICVGKLTIIGSDNGLSPGRRQVIIWIIAGILLIGPLGTNFSEILIEIRPFSFKKMHLKMSPGKWRPFCLGLNVLIICDYSHISQGPLS